MTEPQQPGRQDAANAARAAKVNDRYANRLLAHGWTVVQPEVDREHLGAALLIALDWTLINTRGEPVNVVSGHLGALAGVLRAHGWTCEPPTTHQNGPS